METRKPRQPSITYAEVSKVEKLIREGKGSINDLVLAGVNERTARKAVKKLKAEGIIKESFVVVE